MKRYAVAVALSVATAWPAHAASDIETAARKLRASPVYVAKGADPTITSDEKRRLRALIDRRDVPVFIAVLRERTIAEAGDVDALPRKLFEATDRVGAYGVIAGRNFRAAAHADSGLTRAQAGELATVSFHARHPRDNDGRVFPMLVHWVRSVDRAIHVNRSGGSVFEPPTMTRELDPAVRFQEYTRIVPRSEPVGFGGMPWFFLLACAVIAVAAIARGVGSMGSRPPPVGGFFDDGPEPLFGLGPHTPARPRERDDEGFSFGSSGSSVFDDDAPGGGSWGSTSDAPGGGSWGSTSSGSSSFDDDDDSQGGSW